jgi:hypothetical protein
MKHAAELLAMAASEMVFCHRGAAETAGDGRVTVTLPDYFPAACRSPMVQLTGIGSSDVFVAQEVVGNHFSIGGKPGTRVYWTVTGERRDAVAEQGRRDMPVEQVKTAEPRERAVGSK